jgi:hypothetical protein
MYLIITTTILFFLSGFSSVQNVAKIDADKNIKNQEKLGENFQNQLLNSGEFSSGDKFQNQETPDQIRRFSNPVLD